MKTKMILGVGLLAAVGFAATLSREEQAGTTADYVLHEWGTFTTVSGSDGVILGGLEREEEHLPRFVYSHAGMENGTRTNPGQLVAADGRRRFQPEAPGAFHPNLNLMTKGMWRRQLRNVKVKMETPVVYFYTDDEVKVDLRVGFKGGSISQWFPHRSEGEVPPAINQLYPLVPKPGEPVPPIEEQEKAMGIIDFGKGYDGWIRWKVDVLPRGQVDPVKLFRTGETPTWMYPKVPKAAVVRNELGEHEDFLFYRGVGNFGQPLKVTVDQAERLMIRNDHSGQVPFALVFENRNGVIRYKVLEQGVAGGAAVSVPEADLKVASENWKEEVYVPMREGLIRAGLYREEAEGMVRTWWQSYFETQGLRVFWVVPEGFTNEVLPLEAEPAPREVVRVIVGRSEVLRPRFEKELVEKLTSGKEEDEGLKAHFLRDRFGLAYEERVKALTAIPPTARR